METGLVPGLVRKDSRSKSHSSDDNRQYETLNLGDIKRVKSTHLDRKLSTSARFPKRQTIIEHQRKPLDGIGESNTVPNGGNAPNDLDFSLLEFEIIDETEFLNDDDELDQPDEQNQDTPATLSDLTQKLRINTSPTASLRMRQVHPSAQGSQHLMNLTGPPKKRQYLSELSALELFIVKHLAVLTLAPIVSDHFTLEELLDLIGQRKQTLWGRFVKGLKTDKKKSKVEGTFGVPLEVLVDRNGVDSALGAGPGRIRIPSFVDDSITAMRNMDMSVEGVFRKNGNIRRLKDLSESIDKDPSSVNLSEDNPVQVAALLKKFLRDLPDPLLTFKLHRLFVVSQKMEDEAVRKTILHLTCCLLPKANRDSMEAICLFLRWVASFSHVDEETGSKMDLHNLATVLTPNVLYSKSKDPIKDESFLAIEAVMGLLSYQEDFCMVPEDVSLILSDQDLVESSMDLSSKDILKRCENLVRTKVKKSHSLGDIYHHEQQWSGQDATGQPGHSKEESAALRAGKAGTLGDVHHPPPPHQSSSREQSVPVMIHRQRQNSQQTNHFQQQQQQQQQLHPLQHSNQHHQQYSQYQQHPHQQQQHHQHQRHQRQHSSGTHGLSMSNPASSASSTLPMRIPERPQAVSVGGGKGATPMSL
ncbi:hypothetical protein BGX34_008669 [Mortierella sp. NVP85]|nr:hypothetical protein BGX34_008669 [Mortierella sp. NVP85]